MISKFKMAKMGEGWASVFVLFTAILGCFSEESEGLSKRKVSSELNPGCRVQACSPAVNGSFVTIGYSRAVGTNDTLHYIISSLGQPTLLVVQTSIQARMSIDWDKLLSSNATERTGAISFSHTPLYSYAVVLNRLLEYNDRGDKANLNSVPQDSRDWRSHDLSVLIWQNSTTEENLKDDIFILKSSRFSSEDGSFVNNGSLVLKFSIHGTSDRAKVLPSMKYTSNSAQVDFSLDHMATAFASSRFALEVALITTDDASDSMAMKHTTEIDDEYTPGVFTLNDWISSSSLDDNGAYIQWKPVAYYNPTASRAAATMVKNYGLSNKNISQAISHRDSIASLFLGKSLAMEEIATSAQNISFGLSKDKFYAHANYTSWTFNVGYGQPPAEKVSLMIIIVISVGLGIPVILVIMGGIYICIRNHRIRKRGFEELTSSYTGIN